MNAIKPIQLVYKLQADAKGALPDKIELCRVGAWRTPWHGDFELTAADLQEAVGHFNAGVYRVQGTEPLPGTLDHMGGAATFRITNIYLDGEVLMGDITWTELGKEKVLRDEYRYISMEYNHRGCPLENPEKAGEFWVNVLTGATLTNDPLFKKLKPVMASARAGSDKLKGDSMKLEDLRAKDPANLSDEEKTFLTEHKAELTDDERSTFGLTDPAPSGDPKPDPEPGTDPKPAPEGDPKPDPTPAPEPAPTNVSASAQPVTISRGELEKLQANAKAGMEAKLELDRERLSQKVMAHVKTGRIKSEQQTEVVDILMASAPAMRTRLESLFASLPENRLVTQGAQGSGADEPTGTSKADQLNASVTELAAKENIPYSTALARVIEKNPHLADYRGEE
ncbi:phage protease [Streptomyces europaeiscabiei]|uniref:phage protease n=1 Tax=Streptomyces europaeiscabiei TaxID=146819 RepID=UPI000AFF37E0|nr:phage protease [Streptomyces europaeiscabiei]